MSDVYYDPFDFDIDDDPFPVYRRLRDEAPLYFNDKLGFYALSRYDDVKAALTDWAHLSSVGALTLEDNPIPPSLITMDPPAHEHQRSLVSRVFTGRRVTALEGAVRDLCRTYLDRLLDCGDLVQDFSSRLPVAVICQLLGVPASDHEQMRAWTITLTDALVTGDDGTPQELAARMEAAMALAGYFDALVTERRERPADDLVTALAQEQAASAQFSHHELLGFLSILLLAGNDTTNLLLGNIAYWLTRHPEERRRLLADPSLVPGAIEETMRFDNSIHLVARSLPAPVVVRGEELEPGRKVALVLGAANRDERAFDDPDRYDIRRPPTAHLALGHGIHFCVGAALARLEVKIALEEILARVEDFEVDVDRAVRARLSSFHGFRNLPVALTAR